MGLNVEASVLLPAETLGEAKFSWASVVKNLLVKQNWDIYQPTLADLGTPAWKLLYDEYQQKLPLDESEETTLLVLLGHSDTVRIQASHGQEKEKGTQYFWLPKDSYGFFPPLTIRNKRGDKATFSCLIRLRYIDRGGYVDDQCRVTFEAENNLDFRLGTGPLRRTGLAKKGDIAAISRIGERDYELRIVPTGTPDHTILLPYLITFTGHQGKRYGFIDNAALADVLGLSIGAVVH
jgi:hypothetical protein